jgi:phosphoribosyl-AMP cyclohydrolase
MQAMSAYDSKIETGTRLAPRFDAGGLISAIAADAKSGEVLMLAHMDEEALRRTMTTGEAWFWSRSRRSLWKKGESSGNVLKVLEIRIDCDQDAVLLKVEIEGNGAACHTGRRSCFYRRISSGATGELIFDE